MDAATADLMRYEREQDRLERRDAEREARITDYMKTLLSEGGDLWKYDPANFVEAIAESGLPMAQVIASFYYAADQQHGKNDHSNHALYVAIDKTVTTYLEAVARKIAERKVDEDMRFL